jgi:hypothetical protein
MDVCDVRVICVGVCVLETCHNYMLNARVFTEIFATMCYMLSVTGKRFVPGCRDGVYEAVVALVVRVGYAPCECAVEGKLLAKLQPRGEKTIYF